MSFLREKRLWLVGSMVLFVCAAHAEQGLAPVDCVINPFRTADVSSPVPGVLKKVNVARSAWVEQGQIVANMENAVERATVALAKKRAEIDSEVQLADVNLLFDERRQVRIGKLHERQAVSVEIRDEANREAELSKWELQQAQDLRNIRKLELQRAKAQLEQKNIRAPMSGFVAKVFRETGEYVEDQPIVRIVQLDPLLIEAVVPMELFGKVKTGMQGMVYPELQSDQPREATVIDVDPMGDAASRTFGVRLRMENPEYQVPAGLKCELKFNDDATVAEAGYPAG